MRELNTCLKLNFLCRKIPVLIGSILLLITYIEAERNCIYIDMDRVYVLESLFLIIYAAYNYKNSFIYWVSMGGRKRGFYLSSFILFTVTVFVVSYVQSLIFIQCTSQNQIFGGQYGKLDMLQVVKFTPAELWLYQFLAFMSSICAGSLLGVLQIKYDFGKSLAISIAYFVVLMGLFMCITSLFREDIRDMILTQFSIYLFQTFIYGISICIGLKIIMERRDLSVE